MVMSIRTTTNAELTHNYVVVDFGHKVLIADGTENIIGRTDLANSKYGLQTGGFIIASKDEFYSGLNQQGYKKTVEELGLLWGIYDPELANQFKGDYDLKELTGRYGLQCQD